MTSRPDDLLDLEETIRRLKPFSRHYLGTRPIPVNRIVGTEGRARDFDRRFVPRRRDVVERLRRVSEAFPDGAFPPIDVFRLGEAYFVVDGHHRVAAARRKGVEHIDAEITELRTDWTLPADADMALIVHVEQQRWLEETSGLAEALPDVRIRLSRTADFVEMLENVQIHGFHLMTKEGRSLSAAEIARHWYETIYAPVVEVAKAQGATGEGQTEGDFFLELYRRRRQRYAEGGCPPLEETVPQARVEAPGPWWKRLAPFRRTEGRPRILPP